MSITTLLTLKLLCKTASQTLDLISSVRTLIFVLKKTQLFTIWTLLQPKASFEAAMITTDKIKMTVEMSNNIRQVYEF